MTIMFVANELCFDFLTQICAVICTGSTVGYHRIFVTRYPRDRFESDVDMNCTEGFTCPQTPWTRNLVAALQIILYFSF